MSKTYPKKPEFGQHLLKKYVIKMYLFPFNGHHLNVRNTEN